MAIQGIEQGKVDWSAVVGGALANKGAEGAKDATSAVLDGDNVTISVRDPASGTSVSRTVALPQLREGSEAADAAKFLTAMADDIDQLVSALKVIAQNAGETEPTAQEAAQAQEKAQSLVSTLSSTRMTNAQQALFSIYELMALMQQIAQQQRNSAREIRMTELQSEVASIKGQADHQRKAALYGMIVSVCTTAVQAGMLVQSCVKGVQGIQSAGQTGAGQNLTQAQADVKTLEAASKPMPAGAEPGALSPASARVQSLEANASEAARQNVDGRLTDVTNAKARLDAAQTALDNPPENADLDTLRQDVATAKANYRTALNDASAQMDAEYAEATQATQAAEGKFIDEHSLKHPINNRENAQAMDSAQKTQSALGEERTLLKAKIAEAKANLDGPQSLAGELEAARGNVFAAETALKTDPGYALAMGNPAANGAYQQLTQMIGTLGQSLAQTVQAAEEAKGTEEQAAQKELEVRRDETTALFQQAQELVNGVLDLLKAVIQAESQSVEQIIRA